jgi:hypothetical protein
VNNKTFEHCPSVWFNHEGDELNVALAYVLAQREYIFAWSTNHYVLAKVVQLVDQHHDLTDEWQKHGAQYVAISALIYQQLRHGA